MLGCTILPPNTLPPNTSTLVAAISSHRENPRYAAQPSQRERVLDPPASASIALHPVIAGIGFLIYYLAVLELQALGLTILYPLSSRQTK
ncbi:MAG: hypothetical protein ACRERE_41100 [Candidatus Entotheonellia bacterium]